MALIAVLCSGCASTQIPSSTRPSIDESGMVALGGASQWIMIHGKDREAPVLLFLHGGPGTPYSAFIRKYQAELEKRFVVVNWDQRGSGKSYSPALPRESLTINRLIEDTHELTAYLERRFGKGKIFLVGHSWGSRLGLLVAQRYPDDYYAFVGTGQVTSEARENEEAYRYLVAEAARRNDRGSLKRLEETGPQPYGHDDYSRFQRKLLADYTRQVSDFSPAREVFLGALRGGEYNVFDAMRYTTAWNAVFEAMQGEIERQEDLASLVPELKMPVFFLEGRYDYTAPSVLTERYCERLVAPSKKIVWFERSTHFPPFEESASFERVLIDEVLPLAQASRGAPAASAP